MRTFLIAILIASAGFADSQPAFINMLRQVQTGKTPEIPPGAVAWWRFNASTLYTDLIGQRIAVPYFGSETVAASLYLPGQNSQLTVVHDPSLNAGGKNLSVAYWMFPTALSTSLNSFAIQKYNLTTNGSDSSSTIGGWYHLITSTAAAQFRMHDGTNSINVGTPSSSLKTGEWWHITATYNGTNSIIYLDGIQMQSTASTRTPRQTTESLYIGANKPEQTSTASPGYYSDIVIYQRALSSNEVVLLFAATKGTRK